MLFFFASSDVSMIPCILSVCLTGLLQNVYVFTGVFPHLERLCFLSFHKGCAEDSSKRYPDSKALRCRGSALLPQRPVAGGGSLRMAGPSHRSTRLCLIATRIFPKCKGDDGLLFQWVDLYQVCRISVTFMTVLF